MGTTNNMTFVSGNEYALSQLCSGANKIVIPDLQRDYCWGDRAWNKDTNRSSEIVGQFIEQLWLLYKSGKPSFTLGMIYGYEYPRYHINLCDGQQRITTIYLLLGMLNRISVSEDKTPFGKYLMSQDEEAPYLQYAIRETSLYFLDDLVTYFFLRNDIAKADIKKQLWYFTEYDSDATVTSMLAALGIIDDFLEDKSQDVLDFGKFLVNNIKFLYYDMGDRQHGEETFVVINTTGEPLTPTENLKPILIGSFAKTGDVSTISKQWEDREDWFWEHKDENELTSDALSRDFYTWWIMVREQKQKDAVNLIKDYNALLSQDPNILSKVHEFYLRLAFLMVWSQKEDVVDLIESVSPWACFKLEFSKDKVVDWWRGHLDILLPMLYFQVKYPSEERLMDMFRRVLKNYYIGQTTKGEDGTEENRPYVKLLDLLEIIGKSQSEREILENTSWYNEEEQWKTSFFKGKIERLLALEKNEMLRFDLNVIRKAEPSTCEDADSMAARLQFLHDLAIGDLSKREDSYENRTMSNQYRILKFLEGWGSTEGKQYQVNGRYWGIWFNSDEYLDNLSRAYSHDDMKRLLKTHDGELKDVIEQILKNKIRLLNQKESVFSEQALSYPRGVMQAWLIAKMLVNGNKNECNHITGYNGYSLCVDQTNNKGNIINKDLPISIGNMCLHHANKSGAWTVSEENYCKYNLDTPLCVTGLTYNRFAKGEITDIKIKEINDRLGKMLTAFLENT